MHTLYWLMYCIFTVFCLNNFVFSIQTNLFKNNCLHNLKVLVLLFFMILGKQLNFSFLFLLLRLTLGALGLKLNDYWKEVTEKKAREREFQSLDRDENEDKHDADELVSTVFLTIVLCPFLFLNADFTLIILLILPVNIVFACYCTYYCM